MQLPVILVSGANGQLGNELKLLSAALQQYQWVFTGSAELNITATEQVGAYFEKYKPAFFINTAAYTAVDKAESKTEKPVAMAVNAEAVAGIAQQCALYNTRLIHISTDYVFDGTAENPITEGTAVKPVNWYGFTKLKGEQSAMSLTDAVIIRTSWVYSSFGHNFVKTMMRLMQSRTEISVVNDQMGSPTYAAHLATAIVTIIEQNNWQPGVYHFCDEGRITWYEFACAIRDAGKYNCTVLPIATTGYPTPAKRPRYSLLNCDKIKNIYGVPQKPWQLGLDACMDILLTRQQSGQQF